MATLTRCPRCQVRLLAAERLTPDADLKCPSCLEPFRLQAALDLECETVAEAICLGVVPSAVDDPAGGSQIGSGTGSGSAGGGFPAFGLPASTVRAAGGASDSSIGGSGITPADDEGSEVTESLASRSRRNRPQGSIVATFIMLIFGGVVGIGGALIILKFVQGDKFKSPIPLPDISWKRIEPYLPWTAAEPAPEGEATSAPGPAPTGDTGVMPDKQFIFDDTDPTATATAEPEGTDPFPSLVRPPRATSAPAATAAPAATGTAATVGTKPAVPKSAVFVGAPVVAPTDLTDAIAALGKVLDSPLSAEAYDAACAMERRAAFVDPDQGDSSLAAAGAAATLLETLSETKPERFRLSEFAAQRLAAQKSAPAADSDAAGVIVSGVILNISLQRRYRVVTLLPLHAPNPDKAVTIVTGQKFKTFEGGSITVGGVLVADPAKQLPGTTLPPGRPVVWAATVVDHPAE